MKQLKFKKITKTLGTDGLPIEIYKRYLTKLAPILLELYREVCETKEFHLSARRGVIALLEKPDRVPTKLPNWKPLTMLNCDYKLYAKILATRLAIVLPKLIDTMKSGFMKGHNIASNALLLNNIIDQCHKCNILALLVSFNFYKAFDSVEWNSMKIIMEKYNFGENTFLWCVTCIITYTVLC